MGDSWMNKHRTGGGDIVSTPGKEVEEQIGTEEKTLYFVDVSHWEPEKTLGVFESLDLALSAAYDYVKHLSDEEKEWQREYSINIVFLGINTNYTRRERPKCKCFSVGDILDSKGKICFPEKPKKKGGEFHKWKNGKPDKEDPTILLWVNQVEDWKEVCLGCLEKQIEKAFELERTQEGSNLYLKYQSYDKGYVCESSSWDGVLEDLKLDREQEDFGILVTWVRMSKEEFEALGEYKGP